MLLPNRRCQNRSEVVVATQRSAVNSTDWSLILPASLQRKYNWIDEIYSAFRSSCSLVWSIEFHLRRFQCWMDIFKQHYNLNENGVNSLIDFYNIYRPWWRRSWNKGKYLYHISPPWLEGFEGGMLNRIWALIFSDASKVGGIARPKATR